MGQLAPVRREIWKQHLATGGRLILYEYCVSLLFVTLRRPVVVRVQIGDNRLFHALPYLLISLLLGWWGMPWGLIHTPMALMTNLRGGIDVTGEIERLLEQV